MSGAATVHPLHGNQRRAVDPGETVWLSASAGTGKTQVLSSRVLRLLLQPGVEPSQILCLTFTKAGATEMAARINGTLAEWVRLGDPDLFARLEAIGAPTDAGTMAHARTLFAAVLDCPGGGLRIDTIHAFSQWLLATFPLEADLIPGSRPMEDRERVLLARQVLADLLVHAESDPMGDPQLLKAVEELSLRHGPDAVEGFLLRCASARAAWIGPGSWQAGDMRANVLRLLGLPGDADADWLAAMCGDGEFDLQSLHRCMEINHEWGTKTGLAAVDAISEWLLGDAAQRVEAIDALSGVFLTQKGEPRSGTSQEKIDPAYRDYSTRVVECIGRVRAAASLLALAERLVPALRLGRAFALAWDEAKQREGLIDFDDQIRRAADLLGNKAQANWIRYKLDRRFDHILVDEAQDTNAAQWDIIFAMAEEFWAGLGQRGEVMRTLFVVGDYKQAIFRFQGTSPENFRRAADRVRREMLQAAENVEMLRSNQRARRLIELGLDRSFRTAQDVLDFVDRAIAGIGHENFGLDEAPERHEGQDRPGYVALWQPIGGAAEEDEEVEEQEEGTGQTWLSRPDRRMADNIAQQVRTWLDPLGDGFSLVKGRPRRADAGDIMVLVRQRKELAGLIVARLHAAGVPVAGVDRLRLGAPLAVKDLVAALRFAVQPLDDLNLASLLVSPLVGWSQEQLLQHGYRSKHTRLWEHLRRSREPDVAAVLQQLGDLLALADYEPPQDLLHWLLVGPWQGRRRFVARLGTEANDPIDELINAAKAYVATDTPSLAGFLAWFDAGDGELKREADNAAGLVRVMTVHGSKGLQAPIVILADATGNPESARERGIDLPDPANGARAIPLPPLSREEKQGRIAERIEANRQADEEEHWRLLYVAMTRAEESLFVGGALGARDREGPPPKSWYARLRALFPPEAEIADPIWGARCEHGNAPRPIPVEAAAPELPLREPLPTWLERAPPAEPRPPRPLAPSALGEEDAPDPPFPPGAGRAAARRGTLVHRLLERLPEVAGDDRVAAGRDWLERHAADLPAPERDAMLDTALRVLAHPDWGDLFAPGSLAEVPVAAVVGGQVVAGTIDRLVVAPDRVRLVDYKTARRPPESLEQVPRGVLRQMAAYAAALETTFPGRTVEVALLYTAAPRLIAVPADVLSAHKPDLAPGE
ncbi:double-strand break repair helicase AddA [Novosphingobium mangrovi (ex Huang et al. 2023)]|uniref:DNA 3'-5' helicase n=1 Tax=Novosphingobium mangrovi (ex Huang et al. 2023) TaxID=2976432 RepID=A0ABT2I858_9SPHN|nr:double-strand break repair helicase AddA [Novosphingobium mangrovi (ex Huang et al. 2023)]MCT2401010.1 double-strand break repair helicase AddA [Novosphingobium mangrovi (ex Huang et al. 2023)]